MSEGLTDRAKRLFNSLTGRNNDVEAPWMEGADYDSTSSSKFDRADTSSVRQEVQSQMTRQDTRARSQAEIDEQDQREMRSLQARLAGQQTVGSTYKEGDGSASIVDHNSSTAGRGRFTGGKR